MKKLLPCNDKVSDSFGASQWLLVDKGLILHREIVLIMFQASKIEPSVIRGKYSWKLGCCRVHFISRTFSFHKYYLIIHFCHEILFVPYATTWSILIIRLRIRFFLIQWNGLTRGCTYFNRRLSVEFLPERTVSKSTSKVTIPGCVVVRIGRSLEVFISVDD